MRILSGIGNAWSDEILFAARLSPVRLTRKLEEAEIQLEASPIDWLQLLDGTRRRFQVFETLSVDVRVLATTNRDLHEEVAAGRFRLASFLGMTGSYGEAAAEYREVRRLEPENGAAWLGESTALVLAGREAEAVASLRKGLVVLPQDPRLAGGLARLLAAAADPASLSLPGFGELNAVVSLSGEVPERTLYNWQNAAAALEAVSATLAEGGVGRAVVTRLPEGSPGQGIGASQLGPEASPQPTLLVHEDGRLEGSLGDAAADAALVEAAQAAISRGTSTVPMVSLLSWTVMVCSGAAAGLS